MSPLALQGQPRCNLALMAAEADGLHPRTRWALEFLGGGETLVVTRSSAAMRAIRDDITLAPRTLGGGPRVGVEYQAGTVGLARTCLQKLGDPTHTLLDTLVERAHLRRLLLQMDADRPKGDLQETISYALAQPGALDSLHHALDRWLRHGGTMTPDPERRKPGPFTAIATRWRELAGGLPTRSGLVRAAVQAVRDARRTLFATGLPRSVVLPGLPLDTDAETLLEALKQSGTKIYRVPDVVGVPAVTARESHANIERELRAAASSCLRVARDRGIPLSRCVVATADLGRYRDVAESAFEAEGAPLSTSLERGVTFEPRGSVSRRFAELAFGAPTRIDWLAVATSSLLRDPIAPDQFTRIDSASRELAIHGIGPSLDAWLSTLGRSDGTVERRLRSILDDVRRARSIAKSDEPAQALDAFRSLLHKHLSPPTHTHAAERDWAASETVHAALDVLTDVARLEPGTFSAGSSVSEGLYRATTTLLDRRGLPLPAAVDGGVTLLDWEAAAEMPAKHIEVLGCDETAGTGGSPVGKGWIDDDQRSLLGLPDQTVRVQGATERFARVCRAATDSLAIRRYRSLPDGKSTAILDLEALLPDLETPAERREPMHVGQLIAHRTQVHGDLPLDLAVRGLIAARTDQEIIATCVPSDIRERFLQIQQHAARLESFDSDDLTSDGAIGPDRAARVVERGVSVSSLSTLATCPQRFFFDRGVRAPRLPNEPDPIQLPALLVGNVMHEALERLWKQEISEVQRPPAAADIPRLKDAFDRAFAATLDAEENRQRLAAYAPSLIAGWRGRWRTAAHSTLEQDVAALEREGFTPSEAEVPVEVTIAPRVNAHTGPAPALHLRGRIDRVDYSAKDNALRIIDFKTGKSVDSDVSDARMKDGSKLQLWLYARMFGSLDPDALPDAARENPRIASCEIVHIRPNREKDAVRRTGEGVDILLDPHTPSGASIEKAFANLSAIAHGGVYIQNPVSCNFCDWRLSCRRLHPPSAERVAQSEQEPLLAWRALRQKGQG